MQRGPEKLIGAALTTLVLGAATFGPSAIRKGIEEERAVSATSDLLKGPGYRVRKLYLNGRSISVRVDTYFTLSTLHRHPRETLREALTRFNEACGVTINEGPEEWNGEKRGFTKFVIASYSPGPNCFPED